MKTKKKKCHACHGLGNIDAAAGFELDCINCDGTGYTEEEK